MRSAVPGIYQSIVRTPPIRVAVLAVTLLVVHAPPCTAGTATDTQAAHAPVMARVAGAGDGAISPGGTAPPQEAPSKEAPYRGDAWTLDRALQAAECASPTTTRIDATIAAARSTRREALARLGPSAALSASYLRNDEEVALTLPTGDGGTPQENIITPLEQESLRFTASLPLVDLPAWFVARQARHQAVAAVHEGDEARALFRLSVAGAYLDVLVADGRLEVTELALASDKARLELVRLRTDAGRERRSAMLRLEADVLASAQARDEAALRARSAREVLSIYVHQQVAGPLAEVSTQARAGFDAARDFDAHPLVAAAQARVAAAEAARLQAWSAFLPRIDGSFSYAYTDPASFSNPDGENWSATLNGTWVLLGSGARVFASTRASDNLRAARASLEEARETVQRDLSRATVEVEVCRRALEVADARIAAATLAVEETRADYEEGAALLVDVQSADAALAQARSVLVESRARAARAILSLEHARGRL